MDLLREKLRARGHHCPGVAAALIGSAVVGGAMSASASNSAANKQVSAANRATDAQTGMFNQTVDMESPFRNMGVNSGQKLSTLLGLAPTTASGGNAGTPYTLNDFIAYNDRIAPNHSFGEQGRVSDANAQYKQYTSGSYGDDQNAIAQRFGFDPSRAAQIQQETAAGQGDPSFGSLLKPFGMDDFHLDPGIQFQTQQGNQALMNSQAAKNGVLSGGALKDLMAYNQSMAGTGYQSAFDRFMTNKQFTLGSLMGMTNLGQAAAGNTVNNASGFSSGIAGSMMGAGNAAAAGTIGAGNALSGAATNAGNSYFLNSLLSKNGSSSGSPAGGVMSDDAIANFA